ncbi:hypothetical protein [Paraburkholderia panacisoli]|jgi:hypothetical protein|nr:hypothetical protein [Paraburkholderia panacisoli]
MAKKSAQFGRFFFLEPTCMVKENFTGAVLEIAISPSSVAVSPLTNR